MHPTAPLFLRHRPTCLPVREAVGAVVGICRSHRHNRHRRRHDGPRRRHDGNQRRSCWWAPTVMNPTAPGPLVCRPSILRVDCAVEGVNRPPRRSRWSRRRRGRRRGRRRWERCWRNRRRGLGQSCGRASPTNSHAAIIFLRLRPRHLDHTVRAPEYTSPVDPGAHLTCPTVIWQRCRRSREKPAQQWDQQQEKGEANDACKISPRPHDVEVSSESSILVSGFLDVLALPSPDIRQRPVACASSTANSTRSALLPGCDSACASTSPSSSTGKATAWPCYANRACSASAITGVHPVSARSAVSSECL